MLGATVEDVIARLRLDTEQFSRSLKTAEAQMGTSTKSMSSFVEGLRRTFDLFSGNMTKAFAPIAALVGAGSIGALARQTINLGDSLLKASDQTQIAVEDLSALNLLAAQNDITIDDLSRSVALLSVNMSQATQQAGAERDAFKAAGIEVADLNKVSGDNLKLLELVAKGLSSVSNSTNRLTIQQQLLGKSSREMTQFLNELGTQGFGKVMAEAQRLGVVMSRDFAKEADAFNDNIARIGVIINNLMVKYVGPAIGLFNDLAAAIGLVGRTAAQTRIQDLTIQIGALQKSIEHADELSKREPGKKSLLTRAEELVFGPSEEPMPKEKLDEFRRRIDEFTKERDKLIKESEGPQPPPLTGDLPDLDARRRVEDAAKKAEREARAELEAFVRESNASMTRSDEDRAQAIAEVMESAMDATETFHARMMELEALRSHLPIDAFTKATLQAHEALAKANGELDRWERLQSDAKQTISSLLTPLEQYDQAIGQLIDQWQAGAISIEQFRRATANLDDWFFTVQQGTENASRNINDLGLAFTSMFEDAIIDGKNFSDVLLGLVKDLERLAMRVLVTEPLLKGLQGVLKDVDLGKVLSAIGGGIARVFSPAATATAVPEAQGGMFSRPTLAMLAESGSPEVVMPKHRMEAWMDQMAQSWAGGYGGGSNVEVNIINNAPNTKVTQKEQQRPMGGRSIDVLIDESVASHMQRPGSASHRTLRSVYGATPGLTGR